MYLQKSKQIALSGLLSVYTIALPWMFQTQRLNEVKREEFELLEAQSIPLRNYLMKHVMPTLTQGLIDCCKTRPEDPIDYIVSLQSDLLI